MEEAMQGADVLISLSTPGPDTVKREWIRVMGKNLLFFAVRTRSPKFIRMLPKRRGAYIVATGRGDFPNQVNNSIGFPGILKGALMVRARKITDNMAIAAAHSLAGYAEKRGINVENIVPNMQEASAHGFLLMKDTMRVSERGFDSEKQIPSVSCKSADQIEYPAVSMKGSFLCQT